MSIIVHFCLLLVAFSYAWAELGVTLRGEPRWTFGQCPAYDDPSHPVMFPFSRDCRAYYSCYGGQAYLYQCPENLYWSQLTYRCDHKSLSSCDDSESQDIKYTAFPGDCNRFYETRVRRCPDYYHWNARLERCDSPQNAGCALSPIPLPPWQPHVPPIDPVVPPSATPPTIPGGWTFPGMTEPQLQPHPEYPAPIDITVLCKNAVSYAYLLYPGDCHRFIYCGPTATVLTCPVDLYWDPKTMSCVTSSAVCNFSQN